MFYHDVAQDKRCRVVDLIDMGGRQMPEGMTETECNYMAAHSKIRAPK